MAKTVNVDWFQPYTRRSDVSVGLIYLVSLNLPREECFKWENVILVGIIPDMEVMPKSINPFVKPLVDEMKVLWKGLRLHSSISTIPLLFRGAILLAASDIPAARKLCGLKGHSAERACSKCFKPFLDQLNQVETSQDLTDKTGQSVAMIYMGNMLKWYRNLQTRQHMRSLLLDMAAILVFF